ncbi:MAG: ATP-binding cassette domain-containing protein [Clostridia bacterium]|nr:ATP-binding cassette domain-containing protein [Clostridia bacterium]
MSETIIDVNNLCKTFKIHKRSSGFKGAVKNIFYPTYEYKKAVSNVSFHIKEGEMVGFIGPNGAGKSTTVKMLSGILYPDSGDITVAGYIPHKQRKEYVANIGVVFGQKSQISWDLSPLDSYEVIRHIYKIPENKYKENLERFTQLLDMSQFINQPVRQLSLGQRMRADIAAALLHSPKIVFFDEPTIGIDVVGKDKIRKFIKTLNQTDNITMIFTTHDMQDIEKTCERLIIIDDGQKLYDGSLENVKKGYVSSRIIEAEFESLPIQLDLQNAEVTDVDNNILKKIISFNADEVSVNEIMTELMNTHNIKDISIKEPEIDAIIRDIYEGKIVMR